MQSPPSRHFTLSRVRSRFCMTFQDLDLFARKMNFAASRIPHEFLQGCRGHSGCTFCYVTSVGRKTW
jgi:hypothetical protein